MKIKTRKLISCAAFALALFVTLNLQLSTAFAQGALTPPGPPAPTMKTLDQIEARTAITNTSSLVTISQPGSYYLTHNLTVSIDSAIDIGTNDVTLDLNGFTLSSTDPTTSYAAILLNEGLKNITILNGHIQGGVTNNGSGVYSGGGFNDGIAYYIAPPVNVRVSGVSVSGCLDDGIDLGRGDSTVVESCTVRTVGSYGIVASTVRSSTAVDCGNAAIDGDQVSDCLGHAENTGIYAYTAQNCYGISDNGNAGISAGSAQNCHGYNNGNGRGLAADNASNCEGESTASGGTGILASTADNCEGYGAGNGEGIDAYYLAIACYGESGSGVGVGAFLANSCIGYTTSGTALSVTHNINSFAY